MQTTGFEDEPLTSGGPVSGGEKKKKRKFKWGRKKKKDKSQPSHTYRIEGVEDAMTREAARKERRRRRRQKRYELLGKMVVAGCCSCCIAAIVIVALLLAEVGVFDKEEPSTPQPSLKGTSPPPTLPGVNGGSFSSPTVPSAPSVPSAPVSPVAQPPTRAPVPTHKPTPAPTVKPTTSPTKAPTQSPAPTKAVKDIYTLVPDQDTYIYRDGAHKLQSFGREEAVLVQNGLRTRDDISNAFSIMTFDTAEIPTFDRLASQGKSAILRLTHEALELSEQDRGPSSITVSRMHSTAFDVETLHGGSFDPSDFWDGPTFLVSPTEEVIDVDITDLVFADPFEDNQLFLMLDNRGAEQEVGDKFGSRESDSPPQLILSNLKD